MNTSPLNHKIKWNYLALAFAIPFLGMVGVMAVSGYTPFGKYSMLYSDMYHQYYPFFVAFRKALLSGDSLLYNWSVGMGMDYLGLISYYLGSPLNLLSVLVPEPFLLQYFSFLVPLKLGFAGLFFAIFLKKLFDQDDLSISLFGGFYGLCAWALGYQWNVMWLDTFALLPLVALGTVYLLRDKKVVLYTVSLFLSIIINYYVGFFTCIFVFLLFFCYEICRWRGFGRFFMDLFRIGVFSVLAIGMTAVLELPALAALQNTQSSVNQFPSGFKLNIASESTVKGLLDAMRQVAGNMNGGLEPTFKEGLPNLYSGAGTIFFASLFLSAQKVKLRDKLCCVVLLLFFMLSFIIRQLDYIWHGFHFTNMIPYRFSFLFSFVMLYMAYRAWLMRRRFKIWQLCLAFVLQALVIICSDKRTDPVFLAYNIGFLLLFFGTMLYGRMFRKLPKGASEEQVLAFRKSLNRRRSMTSGMLLGVMALELILNLVNFGVWFPGTYIANYPRGTSYTASMVRYLHEREYNKPFYRTEVTHSQTLNDGALNDYNGISTFTSSANVRVTEFMKALGYGAKNTYNRYCFEESSPVANLFLNLKYMLERDAKVEENPYFIILHHFGDVYLLQNNAYLPLGFLAESELAEVDFAKGGDPFKFQNELFQAATGVTGNVWTSVSRSSLDITGSDVNMNPSGASSYCTYTAGDNGGSIEYTYTADTVGFMCVNLDLSARNSIIFLKNDEELYSETLSLPQMLSVCQVQPGDRVTIRIICKTSESGSMNIKAAILNDRVFQEGYETLLASTFAPADFSNTRIAGTVNCDRNGLLYTSIPQNGGWSAKVDGKPAEITLVGNAMVALSLTEGAHEIEFVYRNAAFELGWKVSAVCALLFCGLVLLGYKPQRKKGKYER